MDAGADQHEVGAERLHQVELALSTAECLAAFRFGQALEVAEWLIAHDAEAEAGAKAADRRGVVLGGQEVGLEDLNGGEARRDHGLQLLLQIAGQADGCDRMQHGSLLTGRG
jgi:hypothetical protein